MNRARITTRPAAMREARRHYLAMSAGHTDWSFSSSVRIAWSKHRADTRATDFLMAEIAKTIGKHLAGAAVVAALTASVTPASGQVQNQSGWSAPSATGPAYGQQNDGTHWNTTESSGTTFYSDDRGKECWSQPSVTGGQFTSCR